MRILLSGTTGQLGHDCQEVLGKSHRLFPYPKSQLDISDACQVDKIFNEIQPEIILNCAAYTKVDACEAERMLALKANAEGPRILATRCEKRKIKLIHISTDYVFDGRRTVPHPYMEEDETHPLSFYGKSKLMGEQAIMASTDNFVIIRSAWLYGSQGHNFLKTMLRLALQGKKIRVVNDQFGSLTWTYRLAQQIQWIIESNSRGIYHATSEGYGTWYDVAKYFLEKMNVPADLSPCTTAEYPTPAHRPKNSILENQRLKAEGLNLMQPWQKDVDEFVEKYKTRLIEEIRGSL